MWGDKNFPDGLMHEPIIVGAFEDGSDEWLQVRTEGIGASDTASILGADGAFSTCVGVWASKTGNEIEREISDTLADLLHFGHVMEPVIMNELETREGIETALEYRTLAHPEYPFIRANLDGWACLDGQWIPCELKNTSAWGADQWDGGVPLKYQVQVQHQMFVVGAPRAIIATLIGGCSFKWAVVERDDVFLDGMLDKLKDFWSMVVNNDMPMPGELDLDIVKHLHEVAEGVTVVLPHEAHHWAAQIDGAKEEMARWDKLKKEAEAQIWAALACADCGVTPDETVKYKVVTTKSGSKYLRRGK